LTGWHENETNFKRRKKYQEPPILDVATRGLNSEDHDLCVRAAWLHYGAGLTQSEVAKRLGVPSLKAHRLIAKANREGLVRISIEGDIVECVRLEDKMRARFGLQFCEVCPDLDEESLPLQTLSLAGSRFLRLAFESGEDKVIGFGHGRTLAACVSILPKMSVGGLKLVSLLGGLTRRYSATPFDVIHRLAERTGAEAYMLPLPLYANSVEDRTVLLEQRGVAEIMNLGISATLRVVGIGTMEADATILSSGMIEREEFEAAVKAGGAGEILGHIFSLDGKRIENDISARTLSMSAREIGEQKTVALAGGRSKVNAIKAVLASGLIHGIIIDERTARALTA
jgi:DNA-binding transcriptional regulator LsrR (DeoR family)